MNKKDKLLGIDRSITRRDFVGSMMIGTGAILLGSPAPSEILKNKKQNNFSDPWTGYGGVGDYATSNGNTRAVMLASHQLRDGEKPNLIS